MNIKKIFINLIAILFLGVIVLSIVTMIKRSNEPEEAFVIPDNKPPVVAEAVTEETEQVENATEITMEDSEAEETVEIEEGETRTLYTTSSVFVRSGPSVDDSRIASLAVNDEVLAVGPAQDGWQKIQYGDIEAYVSIEYLAEHPLEEGETGQEPEAAPETPAP